MVGRAAPTAIAPSGARRCRSRRQRRVAQSDAPAVSERLAPAQFETPPAARRRLRLAAGRIYGREVSLASSSLIVFCTRVIVRGHAARAWIDRTSDGLSDAGRWHYLCQKRLRHVP